ncbi:MAG TPA: hypothetical protein VLC54_06480 [Anaeromyxobacter sp.]|nr:hypothetical protein [Anaeromyxobacter sp.]
MIFPAIVTLVLAAAAVDEPNPSGTQVGAPRVPRAGPRFTAGARGGELARRDVAQ